MLRFMLGVGVTFVAGASLMWPRIKRWGAAEGTEIALTSLQAEELKEHAASLVNTLISEEETGKNVEEVMKLAITNLMADEELKHQMTQYMAQVMVEAMSWENVLSSGNNYVENVLKDEASINSAHQYFSTAAQRTAEDHDVVDAASKAIWSSIKGLFTWGSGRKKTTADQIEAGDGTEAEIGPGSEVSSSDDETKSADGVASASNSADGGDDDGKDTTKQ